MSTNFDKELKLTSCAIYGRSASGRGSLDEQVRSARAQAHQLGWKIIDDHVYVDAGVSGNTTRTRPALAALEAAAKAQGRSFDNVLVSDTTRISRNLGEVLTVLQTFRRHGVAFYFVDLGLSSNDPYFELLVSSVALQAPPLSGYP